MLFSEPLFLFAFLPLLLLLYFLVPVRARNFVLAVASLLFYAYGEWRFLPWMIGSITFNYWGAIGLDTYRGTPWAKRLLALVLTGNLGMLVIFKYADFLVGDVNGALGLFGVPALPLPAFALPLGISFFTFHQMSYQIDIYRGQCAARRNPLDLALYILFFPQLIAGPIVRYHEIADQLSRRIATRAGFAEGIQRFILGLGKKMIIANVTAQIADQIFALAPNQLTPPIAWLGIICYTLQIYFDFSGYSDMAIGLARMFGFRFPENFNYPYIAASVTDFWHRWHMSLSRWFRDYLYIPLGGNRVRPWRTYLNLFTVFLLCGLWHGASWTFVIWGMYHGIFLVIERLGATRWMRGWFAPVGHAYTLLMVMVGWVFFRADSLPHALGFLAAMAGFPLAGGVKAEMWQFRSDGLWWTIMLGILFAMPVRLALARLLQRWRMSLSDTRRVLVDLPISVVGAAVLVVIFFYATFVMAAGAYNPFIYFRF